MSAVRTSWTRRLLAPGILSLAGCGGPPAAVNATEATAEPGPLSPAAEPERPTSPELRSRFAHRGDHEIHYVDAGAGDPALVFVHGWVCDQSFFQHQLAEFSAAHRCLCVDLPGHGQSSKPRGIYSMARQVEALLAVLDDAEVDAAVMIGHSNGGPIALDFVRRHPERSLGLINLDGMLRPFAMGDASLAPYRGPDYRDVIRATFESMMPETFDPPTRRHVLEVVTSAPRHVVIETFEGVNDTAAWSEERLEVPLLSAHAKAGFWNDDYEEFTRGLGPWVDYHVLDGVGHLFMLEAPERLHPLMREWLSGL